MEVKKGHVYTVSTLGEMMYVGEPHRTCWKFPGGIFYYLRPDSDAILHETTLYELEASMEGLRFIGFENQAEELEAWRPIVEAQEKGHG